jgi:KDO2-lipid IV(A) lauroyltransferase
MKRLKALGRSIGYWALRGILILMPLLPLRVVQAIGRVIGDLIRAASKRRRRIANRNLRAAFGDELDERQREAIARGCFRQFGMFVFECMKFATMADAQVDPLVEVDATTEAILRDVLAQGRSVIFVSAHYGNFELAARWVAMHGHEVLVVVRAARDARTTDLMTRLRRRNGMVAIRRDLAARPMMASLRSGGCVAILADQNADDVIVPFFGRPTGTVDGPARLALQTGVPIVVGMCQRLSGGRFRLVVEGVVRPDPAAEKSGEVLRISAELNRLIEGAIRRAPEQWLWFHNRWRSSPGGGAE